MIYHLRFGIVFQGTYRGNAVAVKEMKMIGCSDPTVINEIRREIDLMNRMRSPYIVNFFGSVVCFFFSFLFYNYYGFIVVHQRKDRHCNGIV